MSRPTFYHPKLDITDTNVELLANEASHALKSRRLKIGQDIILLNGKGLLAECIISDVVRKRLIVSINSFKQIKKPDTSLTIATAIPKGERQKVLIDMLTQLGVQQIIPLQCDYSSSNFNQSSREKWQRITIESCKQSQQAWLPIIKELLTVRQLLETFNSNLNVRVIYADGEGVNMSEIELKCDHLVILIGPEGGFSALELKQLRSAKLTSIKLARAILRTETAAISSASQYFSSIL